MQSGPSIEKAYERLFKWCEERSFAGSDPFDGLRSRLFQRMPLRNLRSVRLAVLQAVKRSPVNLRPLLGVTPGVNPKGIALFALAELSRYRFTGEPIHERRANELLSRLLELGKADGDTLAFGYDFDWQSRVLFAPAGSAAIVPTAFASQAFSEGAAVLGSGKFADAVARIGRFAATRLNRTVDEADKICFSYTPGDSSVIYNASLLAAECLSRSSGPDDRELACRAVNFVVERQREDGSWSYGEAKGQEWVDNFHTAYVLTSLARLKDCAGARGLHALEKGLAFWTRNFFLENGLPRYYSDSTYPVDIHSAAVAIAAAAELGDIDLAEKVTRWTMRNMLDAEGFFYYRAGRVVIDQTPHMRWGQAWMAYALARLVEARG